MHEGLGLIKGKIASIDEDLKAAGIAGLKVPHIGWNSLQFEKDEPLFRYNKPGDYVYYVHSFYGTDCEESIIATSGVWRDHQRVSAQRQGVWNSVSPGKER